MAQAIVERIKVIDADTHVSEPEDLWTSRVSKKWGDLVPHIETDPESGKEYWFFGGTRFAAAAGPAMAGWKEFPPSHPPRMADTDPGSWNPVERLKRMDEYGLHAQVIYPNVGGFGSGRFLALKEPELMLDCVRAYNDFLTEWCNTDPKRLVPIMALPFWDVEAAVVEVHRCYKNGHKGILFTSEPEIFGQPMLADPHWAPLYATAQDLGLTINFHIGSGDLTQLRGGYKQNGRQANYAKQTVMMFLDNSRAVMEVIISGICHRYPKLNIVSVESGVGWVPFVLEALDWQWLNSGVPQEHPEYDLLPSEYFKRQVYACFWFERGSARAALDLIGPDNILYETDFPHPTSMSPGPASTADVPRDFIEQTMSDLPEDVLRKILHDNAARIYRLD
jgi:uncharacterized protein